MMNDPTATSAYQSLQRASQLLDTAAVLMAETSDADLKLCGALNQAVALLTATSRTLVDDSLRTLDSVRAQKSGSPHQF